MKKLTKKQIKKADKILKMIKNLQDEGVIMIPVSTPRCYYYFVRSDEIPEFDEFENELNKKDRRVYMNKKLGDEIFFDCIGL